ncbi:MAG: hypothetical protein O9342_16800 [Beijerinckiaceae bacterium]|nr:hypothetical protein [Beijerinckiaceae bacterium]
MIYPPQSRAEQRELRRKAGFTSRVSIPNENALRVCSIPGCGKPPQARAGRGLSLTHCRLHIQRRNRHGSFWKGTLSAAALKPYRHAAESYLKANLSDFWVSHALLAIQGLLEGAGPVERVVDLKRMKPDRKARAAFARMRRAGVPPLRLLVDHLAITGAVQEDPIRPGGEPGFYLQTQLGKAALRKASGYHSVYGPDSRYDVYPRSAGQFLRIIGRKLDKACEHVAHRHLEAVLALKAKRVRGANNGVI